MGEKTGIAWTDHTFNPWIGCTEVGPGCDNCYARELDARHKWGGKKHWGIHVPRHRTSESSWSDVLKWDRKAAAAGVSRRVFCASLADVFDNEVPREWRKDLVDLILRTPNLSWLLVTKRVGNVERMIADCDPRWIEHGFPDHVRLLITVCNQEEADRDIPKLLALPCKNGISYEPALGPIDFTRLTLQQGVTFNGFESSKNWLPDRARSGDWRGIQWIIVGGESTQGAGKARPFDLAWARRTIAQCKGARIPVFVKQLGSRLHARNDEEWDDWPGLDIGAFEHNVYGFLEEYQGAHCRVPLKDRAGANPAEWPKDLRVQEFPA